MLKQRILTALVLLPLMLGMLFFANSGIWAIFASLIALLGLWEYGRLCHLTQIQQVRYLFSSIVLGLCLYFIKFSSLFLRFYLPRSDILRPLVITSVSIFTALVLIFWLLIVPLWLKHKWKLHPNLLAMAVGWLLILPFWLALIKFGPHSLPEWLGRWHDSTQDLTNRIILVMPLLIVMSIVWVADISAYFIGRAIGKHKLAPIISPNKSWEGAIGAVVCTSCYISILSIVFKQSAIFEYSAVFEYSVIHRLFDLKYSVLLTLTIILTIVSILGDLLESWLKRAAGVKDSSALLPGHGGILDRTDSLLAVLGVSLTLLYLTSLFMLWIRTQI